MLDHLDPGSRSVRDPPESAKGGGGTPEGALRGGGRAKSILFLIGTPNPGGTEKKARIPLFSASGDRQLLVYPQFQPQRDGKLLVYPYCIVKVQFQWKMR